MCIQSIEYVHLYNEQSVDGSTHLSVVLNYGFLRLTTKPIRYAVCCSSFLHSKTRGLRKHTPCQYLKWFHCVSEATASNTCASSKRGSAIESNVLLPFTHVQSTNVKVWVQRRFSLIFWFHSLSELGVELNANVHI